MEKFQLNNGMSVVFAGHSKDYSVCLSVNIGHVNEPSKGIAALFEKTLLLQVKGVIPVFGGTMTAYTTGGEDLEEALEKVAQIFNSTVISEELVEQAKAAIVKQTHDTAPLTMRRMKLLYKHTAFGADWVVTPNEYLLKIESYTAEDVREFANTYYTAANVVLAIAGPKIPLADMKEAVAHCLGNVPAGTRQPKFNGDIYTGGFSRMDVNSGAIRLMFGWDVSKLTLDDSPAANVMMSMFWRRLERAYAEAGIDAQVEFKIAGYYGLRTMRAFVMSPDADAKSLTNVLIGAVNRICDVEATEERMEKSRNAAMVEKLDKYEKSDDKALEVAWQTIGRGSMYNIANRIEEIKDIDADAVRMLSLRVFRGCRPTYIVAATSETDALSYQEVLEKLGLEDMLKDDEKA